MASGTNQEVDPALLAERNGSWGDFTRWCTRSIVVIAIIVAFVVVVIA